MRRFKIRSPRKVPDLPIIYFRLLLPTENVSLSVNMLPGTGHTVKNRDTNKDRHSSPPGISSFIDV